jgi:hypothetical protein
MSWPVWSDILVVKLQKQCLPQQVCNVLLYRA